MPALIPPLIWLKKYKMKIAFGTDVLFDAQKAAQPGLQLLKMKRWFSNIEILKMATGNNAELLSMSGKRSPYAGKIGVIEEGAFADLLIFEKSLVEDLNQVADTKNNLKLIIKDGKILKKQSLKKS